MRIMGTFKIIIGYDCNYRLGKKTGPTHVVNNSNPLPGRAYSQ